MVARTQRLTKRQQRLADKGTEKQQVMKFPSMNQLNLTLGDISPMTDNQIDAFGYYEDNKNVLLHGCAGTGKTFISMFLALSELADKRSRKRKLVIIRSAQPSKALGFLPGTKEQKIAEYEAPYVDICAELYNRGDAYEILKKKGLIEFHCTSFLRGTTIADSIIMVDEIQNMSYQEMRTVLTRTGSNSRIMLCGDTKQDDLTSKRYNEESGLQDIMRVLKKMYSIEVVEFGIEDIVRGGFVRDFIEAEYNLGLY